MSTKPEFLVIQSFERNLDNLATKGEQRRTLLWCKDIIDDRLDLLDQPEPKALQFSMPMDSGSEVVCS